MTYTMIIHFKGGRTLSIDHVLKSPAEYATSLGDAIDKASAVMLIDITGSDRTVQLVIERAQVDYVEFEKEQQS